MFRVHLSWVTDTNRLCSFYFAEYIFLPPFQKVKIKKSINNTWCNTAILLWINICLLTSLCFIHVPTFSVQMLLNVLVLCEFLLNNTVHLQFITFSVLLTKVAVCSPEPHLFESSRQKVFQSEICLWETFFLVLFLLLLWQVMNF